MVDDKLCDYPELVQTNAQQCLCQMTVCLQIIECFIKRNKQTKTTSISHNNACNGVYIGFYFGS